MKKHSILALVLLGGISLGCVKEIPDQVGNDDTSVIPGSTGDPVTVTTTITLPDDPGTKALTAAGVKTFAPGDRVAILYEYQSTAVTQWYDPYIVTGYDITIEAEDIRNGGKSVKIRTVLSSPKENCKIRFIYPANMVDWSESDSHEPDDDINIKYSALATQDGTLASLASNLDLAVYDGRLNGYELPGSIQLENRLAIGEFTVKDDGGNDITSSITSFTVSDGTDTYTVSRAAGPGPIYVAMKPVSGDLRLTAIDSGGEHYIKDVTAKTLDANKMYPIGVTMAIDFRFTPLTFEAITAGTQVSFKLPTNTENGTVQYKLNDGAWTAYTSETAITLANVGDKVQFRGKNSTYFVNTPSYDYGQFSATANCYLYGNIMSLVSDYTTDENTFASNVTLTGEQTFYRLFDNNTNIKSHGSKPLLLPATTLTTGCYQEMFYNCTGLTTAPALPATTLANDCYWFMFCSCTGLTTAPALPATTLADCCYKQMFLGCTGLTTAPDLPATTLADCCYDYMFADCTSLITAPDLPATTLAYGCYEYMFFGCTELTTAPALPATTLADDCYYSMFCGCTSLTTAPDLPATTLADDCYNSMFSGCTELTTAPVLPATTLTDHCYEYMFYGCTKLSSITCLAEGYIDSNKCNNWVYGVAYTGNFTRAANSYWDRGTSGIPHDWTVVNYVAP